MSKTGFPKFLCLLSFFIGLLLPNCKAQPLYTVLKNATVIDCINKSPLYNTTLILKDSLIYDIGKFEKLHIPAAATIIDVTGKYVLPGLIDVHAHVTILGTENGKRFFDRETSEKVLKILLEHGITTVRNPAAPTTESIQLRNDARTRKIISPDIYTSGEAIQFCNGRTPDLWETCVSNETNAAAEVNRQIDRGVDFIKIYSSVPANITKVIIKTAQDRNIPVCGHFGATSWTQAAAFGIDEFEHATDWSAAVLPPGKRKPYEDLIASEGAMKARIKWLEWIDPDGKEMTGLLKVIKQNNIIIDPTLIAYATKFMGDDSIYIANSEMNIVPELVANWKKGTFVDDWTKQNFSDGHKQWRKMLLLIKRYYDKEVTMVIGSDLPNPWVIPGLSLYQEMKFFSQAGIPNYDILKMCTVNSAKALKISSKTGTVEKGKLADIIVLDKNPLLNIENINSVGMVFKKGARAK